MFFKRKVWDEANLAFWEHIIIMINSAFLPSVAALFLGVNMLYAASNSVSFAENRWDRKTWIMVKSPRFSHKGAWIQEKDHIRNAIPGDITEEQSLGRNAGDSYCSMVWHEKIKGVRKVAINAAMSFDDRMAPLLVIAPEIGADENGYPEYREHWEIVLFDKGINIWHHQYADGKPSFYKAANLAAPFPAKTKIEMEVTINLTGKTPYLEVTVGEQKIGCAVPQLKESFFVGLTACEGINRFYNFSTSH